jgi:hypothetical protein
MRFKLLLYSTLMYTFCNLCHINDYGAMYNESAMKLAFFFIEHCIQGGQTKSPLAETLFLRNPRNVKLKFAKSIGEEICITLPNVVL